MSGLILPLPRSITDKELNELTVLRDRLVVMAICRVLQRTDWEFDDSILNRGEWVEYPDGELVFKFDNKECFLLRPRQFDHLDQLWKQRYEWLFNYRDYEHHTAEDEKG